MRINLKLLLTTVGIVVLVSVSSTLIYYSLTNEILKKKEENNLKNSLTSFKYAFDNFTSNIDSEFKQYLSDKSGSLDKYSFDFVFTLKENSIINADDFQIKKDVVLNLTSFRINDFVKNNPAILLRYQKQKNEKYIFYGAVLDNLFASEIAQIINADILIYESERPLIFSSNYFQEIPNSEFQKKILDLNNIAGEVRYIDLEGIDAFTIKSVPNSVKNYNDDLGFIIFLASRDLSDIRSTMQNILLVILIAGILLSVIFSLIFTDKIRRQINLLSNAAASVAEGNFDNRAKIISTDEIGKFGIIFNNMLDELSQKEKREKNYSEFIALINENPGLKNLAYSTLQNIIKSTNFDYGLLHSIRKANDVQLAAFYGIGEEFTKSYKKIDLYQRCIDERNKLDIDFSEIDAPKLNSGSISLEVKFVTIIPIVFYNKVIGILELGAVKKPDELSFDYLDAIEEQLAIGLTNALTLEELEELVTELKQLNYQYQKQNEKITNQNEELKELHAQLSEKAVELEKQKEKAEGLTKLKSEFLANMSHELRTPLNSILGLTELVAKDFSTNTINKNKLAVVLRNGKKLLGLINNILEFSKVELGKNEINSDSFSLKGFIKEIASFAMPLINEKKIDFKVEIVEFEELEIRTDKSKLEQILNNLIGNAIKFTNNGFVKVEFRKDFEKDLIIKVIDSGIGISEENLNIIFDEFRQADGSTSRMFNGTGLGLAISKKYTEMLGGELKVLSEVGRGTTFTLVLPQIVYQIKENNGRGFSYKSGKDVFEKKVIIAVESKASQRFISEYLSTHNVKVIPAEGLQSAIEQLKSISSDAVIIDPTAEKGKGWNYLLELIKEKTPVILSKINDEKQVGYACDVYDFIHGNISSENLNQIILGIEAGFNKSVHTIFLMTEDFEKYENLKNEFSELKINYSNNIRTSEIILSEEIPDIILTDLFIADTSVLTFVEKIKQINSNKNVPVVINISSELSTSQLEKLNSEFEQLLNNSNTHPLDVLGLIKRRLNLKDSSDLKDKLITEEIRTTAGTSESETPHLVDQNGSSQLNVLIVDDDEDTLYTVGEIVKELGCHTIFAHNGIECILALNNITPDLILLDIMMPKMDGFETIKLIRKDPRYLNLPIFALTAHAMLDNKDVIEKNGFNDIVTKPINTDILLRKIKSLVDRVNI